MKTYLVEEGLKEKKTLNMEIENLRKVILDMK